MLDALVQWLEQWRRPIWEAIYRAEPGTCRQLLAQADAAWEDHPGTDDERQALRLYLDFLAVQVDETFAAEAGAVERLVTSSLNNLAQPVTGPLAIAMQARVLLMQRCWAHHSKVCAVDAADIDRLLRLVPPGNLDHQGYSYLAFWAFATGSVDHLKLAYKYFLTQPIDFMVDYSRQRVKVMLMLVEQRCTVENLDRLIGLLPHPKHAQWLAEHIRPAARAHGLWTDQLEIKLAGRIAALSLGKPQVPPRDKPEGYTLNF